MEGIKGKVKKVLFPLLIVLLIAFACFVLIGFITFVVAVVNGTSINTFQYVCFFGAIGGCFSLAYFCINSKEK